MKLRVHSKTDRDPTDDIAWLHTNLPVFDATCSALASASCSRKLITLLYYSGTFCENNNLGGKYYIITLASRNITDENRKKYVETMAMFFRVRVQHDTGTH